MPSSVRRWVQGLVNRVNQGADPEPPLAAAADRAEPPLTPVSDDYALASVFIPSSEPLLDPTDDAGVALSALLRADDAPAIDRVLADYPLLHTADLDAYLTRRLADLWQAYKAVDAELFMAATQERQAERQALTAEAQRLGLAMGELLVARRLLERVREGDYAALLAEKHCPPAKHNPLRPLTKEYARATLDERVKAARYALSLTHPTSEPELWATLEREVGDSLLQGEAGDRHARLEEAQAHYQAARAVWESQAHRDERRIAGLLYAQAAAYRRAALTLPPSPTGTSEARAMAEKAVRLYHAAQAIYQSLGLTPQWALMEHELGGVWLAMPGATGHAHLDQAIEHYRQALQIRGRLKRRVAWAETTTDLAIALTERWRNAGARAALDEAIALVGQVIREPALVKEPRQLSRAFITLGNAYRCRLASSQTDNYRDAIACYIHGLSLLLDDRDRPQWDQAAEALQGEKLQAVSPPPEQRLPWGETLYNLAAVYLRYREGQPTANVEWALALYDRALTVYTPKAYPLDSARIHISRSLAYYNLALLQRGLVAEPDFIGQRPATWGRGMGGAQPQSPPASVVAPAAQTARPSPRASEESLEHAIEAGQAALAVLKPDLYPELWAMLHNNLGNAYADRTDNRAAHRRQAIECYQEALRACSPATLPDLWAVIQNNLGVTYQEQALENHGRGMAQAVEHLREALSVQTPQTYPHDARRTARNLGHLLFAHRDWAGAERAFATAIEATESLYQASVGEAGHLGEMAEAQGLYTHRAYALARLGRLEEAVVTWEQGKARLLGESLGLDRAPLEHAPADLRARFLEVREGIRKLEAGQRESVLPTLRLVTDGATAAATQGEPLREKRRLLDQIIAGLRQAQPDFMPQPNLAAIRATARPDRPLVYLGTTGQGSLALLVPSADAPSPQVQAVWCDGFTQTDLEALLLTPRADAESHSFLYTQMGGSFKDSQHDYMGEHLPPAVDTLGQRLMGALAKTLADRGIESITLIPSGALTLLPLHAAKAEGRYFCEQTCVALAPSALTLTPANQRPAPPARDTHHLLAIANPLPVHRVKDLPCAEAEVEAIRHFFLESHQWVLKGYAARRQTWLKTWGKLAETPSVLHFACHGQFNLSQPLDAGLVLADNDMLTLRDLYGLPRLKARLAVLSACQTAVTDYARVPDEAIGLPAGFLSLGVPGVVGSLWAVPDDSTALLMVKFYENLARPGGGDPARALQDAQKWFRRADATAIRTCMIKAGVWDEKTPRGQTTLAAPEHWAAFVFYGV